MKLLNIEQVDEVTYGVYVCLYDGKYVTDENANFLCISATKGDIKKIEELRRTAKSFGLEDIEVEFISAARKISQSEYEEQKRRQDFGLLPDPLDVPALRDEAEAKGVR